MNMELSNDKDFLNLLKSLGIEIKNKLNIKNMPKLSLIDDTKNSKNYLGRTGFYDMENMHIYLFVTDRHPKDILRSCAHELVHHHQNELGKLADGISESGTVDGYAQTNTRLRQMEKEAYLFGNMLFRDWEDNLKKNNNTLDNQNEINEKLTFENANNNNFSIEKLNSIPSYAKRLQYMKDCCKQIGRGSGRVVFDLSNGTVLKLAWNGKGIAQNNHEIYLINDGYCSHLFPKLISYDDNGTWLILQKANKISPKKFTQLTGINNIFELQNFLNNNAFDKPKKQYFSTNSSSLSDNEFANDMLDLVRAFDLGYSGIGDFGRLSSYGEINNKIVITDAGLNDEIYDDFYSRKNKSAYVYEGIFIAENYFDEQQLVEMPSYDVFHGSPNTFDEFSYEYIGKGVDAYGPGFYFAQTENLAGHFGDVNKWKINIDKPVSRKKRPLKSDIISLIKLAPDYIDTLYNFDENLNIAFREAISSYLEYDNQFDSYMTIGHDFYHYEDKKFLSSLIKIGYDGTIIEPTDPIGSGETVYVLYDTKKAKKIS